MMTDPIADMLARIRNAGTARHAQTACPTSQLKHAVANVLQEAGFVSDVHVEARHGRPVLLIGIRYDDRGKPLIAGLKRVSKPSRRVYVGKDDINKVRNGLGVAVLSTSKGVVSDERARSESVGGELLCEVW
ncbi:MAG: 30S ribosomal protein S8 [Deltaproteobacteria bacterium]|nr:30S ribosomal protein S8 [Deltaproteobacteria bacterium]MBW2360499.1 30S ribosomal protein S8 [Deltaproteobacteria bacterium]